MKTLVLAVAALTLLTAPAVARERPVRAKPPVDRTLRDMEIKAACEKMTPEVRARSKKCQNLATEMPAKAPGGNKDHG